MNMYSSQVLTHAGNWPWNTLDHEPVMKKSILAAKGINSYALQSHGKLWLSFGHMGSKHVWIRTWYIHKSFCWLVYGNVTKFVSKRWGNFTVSLKNITFLASAKFSFFTPEKCTVVKFPRWICLTHVYFPYCNTITKSFKLEIYGTMPKFL